MNNNVQVFPVKPPPLLPAIVLCVAASVFLLGTSLVLRKVAPQMGTFHIFYYLIAIAILVLIVFSTRRTRFEISEQGLRIRGILTNNLLRWDECDAANARVVNLNTQPELKPQRRIFGTYTPGYCSGWVILCNKSKALVFLSDKNEAVYLPTRNNFPVLLTSEDNAGLVRAIQLRGKA